MKISRAIFIWVIICLAIRQVIAQMPADETWQQSVGYTIEAELDTLARKLNGSITIQYRNNSPDTLRRFYLQAPANAFYEESSTAMQEMRRFNNDNIRFGTQRRYHVKVNSVQFLALSGESDFPLQAYDFEDTILNLALPNPLRPGDSLTVALGFSQDLSQRVSRRTFKMREEKNLTREFELWFPRVAVYDQEGWHPEPFHFMMQSSDIYSEFGAFDVTLTVPGNYVVAASGELVDGDPGWHAVAVDTSMDDEAFKAWRDSTIQKMEEIGQRNGPRSVQFRAERLPDFAWSAAPDMFYYQQQIDSLSLHYFPRGGNALNWLREVTGKIEYALDFSRKHFGVYPYRHLSVLSSFRRPYALPYMIYLDDEDYFEIGYRLAGIYVPGMVSTNGVKEAWLANGLQMYMGKALSEDVNGPLGYSKSEAQKDMNWLERKYPLPSVDALVRNFTHLYSQSGQNEPTSKKINEYHDPLGVLFNVYVKSDLFYEMLHYVVGDSSFQAGLLAFVQHNIGQHAGEKELQSAFEETSGQDLQWFFDQWLRRTPTVDYRQGQVRKRQLEDKTWVTEIELQREGDGVMPVDVAVSLPNGKTVVERWDGVAEKTTLRIATGEKPRAVRVDPNDRIMDSNPRNNTKTRLEFYPDWPLLKYIHMPGDAYVVLWRPMLDYNDHDGLRLGARARTSYRAFYNNLNLELVAGTKSGDLDGLVSYSQPFSSKSLLNRYMFMVRKNEGRFEADAHIKLSGSQGILAENMGRQFKLGLNFSSLLTQDYTYREVKSDTGTVRFDEWQDTDVLLAYAHFQRRRTLGLLRTELRLGAEAGLPGGEAQFVKLSSRLTNRMNLSAFELTVRGNYARAFGPDDLPLQDQFRAEGAGPRERFQENLLKTGGALTAFDQRFVEGGGFLRGYIGQPLPAERYFTANFELASRGNIFITRPFLFYDVGRVYPGGNGTAFSRADAGFGLSFGDGLELFGGGAALFNNLSAKLFFPLWLSAPLPGQSNRQWRWYFTLGKSL